MFTIHDGSRDTLAELERNIGFIPNLAATIGASPTAIAGFVGLQTALRSSTLTGLEREVVGVTVSRFNDCAYSLAAHSKFARMQGGDEALVAALVAGEPLADERLEALRTFTLALLSDRGHADVGELVARGRAGGDRAGRLHDPGQLRGRRVRGLDRRRVRLEGQPPAPRFVHVDKDGSGV